MKKIQDLNFYELLEIPPDATSQEIHRAYDRVRRIYDPNSIALYSLFSPEETARISDQIEEAYRTLIYEENRRAYDAGLRERGALADPAPGRVNRYAPRAPQTSYAPPLENHHPIDPVIPTAAQEEAPQAAAQPGPQPLPADVPEFTGHVLKVLREKHSMSIRNLADLTKIGSRYIEWIEEESFDKLPARPYLRGFISLYAKGLGYEQPERLINDYLKRYDAAKTKPK